MLSGTRNKTKAFSIPKIDKVILPFIFGSENLLSPFSTA